MLLRLVVAALATASAHASYCGDSMIPYSFEVLPNGQPILGCARPTCFGWTPSGQPYPSESSFYRISGAADGFSREDRASIPPFSQNDPRHRISQIATCEPGFGSATCGGPNRWVGGIGPLINVTAFPVSLRCCLYEGLTQSEDRGVASVGGGQIVVGGEVLSDGQQYAFDYIADVGKTIEIDGSTHYDVSIRRFACAPLPTVVDGERKLAKPEDVRFAPYRAYQDPNVDVAQPLAPPQPQSEFVTQQNFEENGVIEEIVREEAIQLPPGTQFQQPQVPPPVQQPQFFAPPVQAAPVAAAAQPYYYSPLAYDGTLCFSGDMMVKVNDGTSKRMDELRKNDMVLTMSPDGLGYRPITFWLHRVPNQEAEFVKIETEDGKEIKMTALHYIFQGDCTRLGKGLEHGEIPYNAVFARDIQEGACIWTKGQDFNLYERRVSRVSTVIQNGIYAPMSATGNIVVNDVFTSCHAILQSSTIQGTFFTKVHELWESYNNFFGVDSANDVGIIRVPGFIPALADIMDVVLPAGITTL